MKASNRSCIFVLTLLTACVVVVAQYDNVQLGEHQISEYQGEPSLNNPLDDCTLIEPQPAPSNIVPIVVPSFPGSGSSFVRAIIPLLTGYKMGVPSSFPDGNSDVVALKTHHPQVRFWPTWGEEIHRAIILLRNPMESIPSYCNFVYEKRNDLMIHSVKAPTEFWIEWRSTEFASALNDWVELIEFWMEKKEIMEHFILSYEDVTSDDEGPATAQKLANFFEQDGVKTIEAETIPCVWSKARYGTDRIGHLRQNGGTQRSGGTKREFALPQLDAMLGAIETLEKKYSYNRDLVTVLERYHGSILTERVSLQEQEQASVTAN